MKLVTATGSRLHKASNFDGRQVWCVCIMHRFYIWKGFSFKKINMRS